MSSIKKSEFISRVARTMESLLSSQYNIKTIGEAFSDRTQKRTNLDFTKQDFIHFLSLPYLVKFSHLYSGLFDKSGDRIANLDDFYDKCADDLLVFFKENGYEFQTDINVLETDFEYMDGIAKVVVNRLEQYGKPPLFHKSQDKVLRYEWAKENDTAEEVLLKVNKKLPGLFFLSQEDGRTCLRTNSLGPNRSDEVYEQVRSVTKKIKCWYPHITDNTEVLILN